MKKLIIGLKPYFKYLFYRYNMNDRDLRTKKHSLATIRNTQDKTINNSYIRNNANCQPKQPPNISRHYLETKKKQTHNRQLKHDIHPFNPFNAKFDMQIYTNPEISKSKMVVGIKPARTSHSKYPEQGKPRKNKRLADVHHISKAQKLKQPKPFSKENRESRSNLDFEDFRKDKIVRTEAKLEDRSKLNLKCKQTIMQNLRRNLKPSSCDLGSSSHVKIPSQQQYIPIKSFAQQIAEFQEKITQINIQAQSKSLSQLFTKEQSYSKLQNYNCYLSKRQPDIDWKKRAKVMNWMLEILSELGSKRQIFALAANYVDRYLASTYNIPTKKLQVLACGAMSLANKIEGLTFLIPSLVIPDQITLPEILQYEQNIALTLKWKLNPPTANMWANRIAQHWDIYLDHHKKNLPNIIQDNFDNIKFKTQDGQGYRNFRTLTQYIDLVVLDVSTLQYHNREISASFIYIILNIILKMYNEEYILHQFSSSSQYLLKENELNDFYCQFLQHSFGFCLQDLLPTVQYCSTFLALSLSHSLPQCINQEDEVIFSELCSLQTYNPNNLICLESRDRSHD